MYSESTVDFAKSWEHFLRVFDKEYIYQAKDNPSIIIFYIFFFCETSGIKIPFEQ